MFHFRFCSFNFSRIFHSHFTHFILTLGIAEYSLTEKLGWSSLHSDNITAIYRQTKFNSFNTAPILLQHNQLDALISQIYFFGIKFYTFQTVPLFIARNFSLYTQQWYMSYRFADILRARCQQTCMYWCV